MREMPHIPMVKPVSPTELRQDVATSVEDAERVAIFESVVSAFLKRNTGRYGEWLGRFACSLWAEYIHLPTLEIAHCADRSGMCINCKMTPIAGASARTTAAFMSFLG